MILIGAYLPTTGNSRHDTWLLFRQAYEVVDETLCEPQSLLMRSRLVL